MPKPNRFVAVDTEVVLALTAGDEECQEAIDSLSHGGFYFLVTETVLQELGDIKQQDSDIEASDLANMALCQITNFNFLQPSLGAVEMGVAEQVAHKLNEKCLENGAVNDGFVIAEAAYNDCGILVTKRKALLESKNDSLGLTLVDFDLSAVVVASPSDVVSYFRSQRALRQHPRPV